MKRITIGRSPGCNIVIDQNMVSRSHALLNIYPGGRYEIVSMGTNGTKVNGILIANGQPYPLKRGDAVVFATQAQLDWSLVPNPSRPWKIAAIVSAIVLGVAALSVAVWLLLSSGLLSRLGGRGDNTPGEEIPAAVDSTRVDSTAMIKALPDAVTEVVDSVEEVIRKVDTRGFFPKKKKKQQPAPQPAKPEVKPEAEKKETPAPAVKEQKEQKPDNNEWAR